MESREEAEVLFRSVGLSLCEWTINARMGIEASTHGHMGVARTRRLCPRWPRVDAATAAAIDPPVDQGDVHVSTQLDSMRPDPARPGPTRPDPTRPDPTRPDPTYKLSA